MTRGPAAAPTAVPTAGSRIEPDVPVRPPALSPRELGAWGWRQLTSMRTALLLLLALALAAVPGSLVPQQGVDSLAVARFAVQHPELAPWLYRLGMFSVYSSPWFAAIYLLLVVSLVGCIVPRTLVYARALTARPPRGPRRLDRMPAYATYRTHLAPDQVLAHAAGVLGARRFRTDTDADLAPGEPTGDPAGGDPPPGEVRAERGYLREAGNLVFHVSLVAVLVGVAAGSLWGYRGNVIVVEGSGFSNTLTQYDEFSAGAMAGGSSLPPFSLVLDTMTATFRTEGAQASQPELFEATGTLTPEPGADPEPFELRVNHPVSVEGTSVFLVGSGYAPVVTVRDGGGQVVSSGPVPFLPTDSSYVSEGVVKAPDAEPAQLGLEGFFLPSAARDADGLPVSVFPEAVNPVLSLFAHAGDLGLDDGVPQSVYSLDKDDLELVLDGDGAPLRLLLRPGQSRRLPDGLGTVTFEGVAEFARLQVSATPLAWLPLTALAVAVGGLLLSLYVRPRRTWVRVCRHADRTVVEVASLDRVARTDPERDLAELVADLRTGERTGDPNRDPNGEPT